MTFGGPAFPSSADDKIVARRQSSVMRDLMMVGLRGSEKQLAVGDRKHNALSHASSALAAGREKGQRCFGKAPLARVIFAAPRPASHAETPVRGMMVKVLLGLLHIGPATAGGLGHFRASFRADVALAFLGGFRGLRRSLGRCGRSWCTFLARIPAGLHRRGEPCAPFRGESFPGLRGSAGGWGGAGTAIPLRPAGLL